MIVLINTCGAEASVALADAGKIVAQEAMGGREASEQLVPALRRLLAGTGRVQAVGVVHGPGSFTGVRVGLSAAKGLCEAYGAGLIAMSRLALVAAAAENGEAVAVLDAGRGEFYCGLPREELLKREALLPLLAQREVLTCEPRVQQLLAGDVDVRLIDEPGPGALLRMALARMGRGEWNEVATADANYLRRTDAELLVEGR